MVLNSIGSYLLWTIFIEIIYIANFFILFFLICRYVPRDYPPTQYLKMSGINVDVSEMN